MKKVMLLSVLLCMGLATAANADLLAFYKFDGVNDWSDSMGNWPDAVPNNPGLPPSTTTDSPLVGRALDLSQGGLNCGNIYGDGLDISVAFWMKTTPSMGSYTGPISKIEDSSLPNKFGWHVLTRPAGENSVLIFRMGAWQSYGGWGQELTTTPDAYSQDHWTHWVFTYNHATDTAIAYRNGVFDAQMTGIQKRGVAGAANKTEDLTMGAGHPEGDAYKGLLDEVAYFNEVVSAENAMKFYLGDYSAYDESLKTTPPDGATVPVTFDLLEWELPEPNDPVGGTMSCDVWFSDDYPNYGQDPNNSDFTDYATKIVNNEAVESISVPVVLEPYHTYYWRIDLYDDSLPQPPAQPSIGQVFTFNTNNMAPKVDAGIAEPTWLVDGTVDFDLLGELTEDDGLPVPATLLWTVANPDLTIITDPTQPGITVTATGSGLFVVTLTADDTDLTGSDTVSILIYENECVKMKEMDSLTPRITDHNGDCVTDVLDVAIFAREWLLRIDESR